MFNEARLEKIRSNIKVSTILSDSEKSDWLNLLDLMNDKQLGELEEILAAEPPKAETPVVAAPVPPTPPVQRAVQPVHATQPAPQQITRPIPAPAQPPAPRPPAQPSRPAPAQSTSPLSHIANFPKGVNMNRSMTAAPVALVPQAAPLAPAAPAKAPPAPFVPPVSPPRTNFTPLAVRATPSPNLSQPTSQQPPKFVAPQPAQQSAPQNTGQFVPQRPAVAPAPTQQPAESLAQPQQAPAPQPPTPSQTPYKVEQVEDLQYLSLESLREYSHQSVAGIVRAAIVEHGYFPILGLIEASPLYEGYINAGKERLGLQSASGQPIQAGFTQEEFEFVVDLLASMRSNRW